MSLLIPVQRDKPVDYHPWIQQSLTLPSPVDTWTGDRQVTVVSDNKSLATGRVRL